MAQGSTVSLALDGDGNVCSICAGGGYGLHLASLAATIHAARNLCSVLHKSADAAMETAATNKASRVATGVDMGICGFLLD